MTIEQQIREAVTEFHDLIVDGLDVSTALVEASSANGLKDGVLEHHLSKSMPLQEIVSQIRHEADRKQRYEIIYNAVLGYVCESHKNWFKQPAQRRQERLDRLEAALGHPPSSEEQAQADAAERKVREEISVRFQRDFARALRNAEPRTNVED
jgi:hypothetical protein